MADIEKLVGAESPFEVGQKINEIIENLGGREIGEFIYGAWAPDYVPKNTLYCDGTQFSGAVGAFFRNLWTNYIITKKLDTCTYAEYQTELTMTGSCYKWAVDTANEKFRIPFIPDKVLTDIDDTVGVKGNGTAIGLINGNEGVGYGLCSWTPNNNLTLAIKSQLYGTAVGTTNSTLPGTSASMGSIGLTTDSINSGIVADTTNAKTYQTIRHFVVVANGSINQSQMDWSAWASGLQGKANTDLSNCTRPYVIETSDKSLMPSWYRVWSDGWCEQGGRVTGTSAVTVTMLKKYRDTNYSVNINGIENGTSTGQITVQYYGARSLTTGNFVVQTSSALGKIVWEAKGYIS